MTDAYGKEHIFRDKMPVFLKDDVAESELPAEGGLRCAILSRNGNRIRIDTSGPDDVESQNGETIFDVFTHQILWTQSDSPD